MPQGWANSLESLNRTSLLFFVDFYDFVFAGNGYKGHLYHCRIWTSSESWYSLQWNIRWFLKNVLLIMNHKFSLQKSMSHLKISFCQWDWYKCNAIKNMLLAFSWCTKVDYFVAKLWEGQQVKYERIISL